MERIAPTVTIISLLLVSMGVQRYLPVISWLLAVVYALMVGASIYYTRQNPAGWNVSVMISSLFVGATMESLGAWEGLWHFHYMEPLSAFMAFTWTLRTWTILTICSLLGARFDT
ncbi:MAG: hypothetical protein JSV18_00770 [Candidatus Bathyarchaeota archaeon]|nr:MAG: hypothetical protein JSV18_00770 [Candidatus Bathyarchaeota archaeon]